MLKQKKIVTFAGILLASTTMFGQSNQNWQIKPIPIQTRWAKDVTPTSVLPEYPRPQMIRTNNWQNLNGLWNFVITSKDAPVPLEYKEKILVPYPIESALSGVKKRLLPSQLLWYQRHFRTGKIEGERTLLHFGAIDYKAWIYLNGREIGVHEGGYTSFSLDITDALRSDDNELVVKVYDPSDEGVGPHGKQVLNPGSIYYTPSSGIWQTVWLESVPVAHVERFALTPDIDREILNIQVKATGIDSSYSIKVKASNGQAFEGRPNQDIRLPVPSAHLWSPDDPFLYDLDIYLMNRGKIIDSVKSYFGMRKIAVANDENGIPRIFLNNKYTYNLGILDQGFWPDGLYTAPTDDALKFDIKVVKSMGFNTIRKHIKIEPARWYYYADKMGMLIWQDFVNPNQILPTGAKEAFENQVKETLTQLHNYPSIVTWVIFNEKWGVYDQKRITEFVKQLDPSRLVNGHSGELLYVNNELRSPSPDAYVSADITDVHSYPFPRLASFQPGKANTLGEFGGIGVPVDEHLWDDLVVGWGYDGVVTPSTMKVQYGQMRDTLKLLEQQGLSASIYTQPFDVESEQNGLITYDREVVKLPIDTIRQINGTVWPITKNYARYTDDIFMQLAPYNGTDYYERLKAYQEGKRDSVFLRHLATLADRHQDPIIAAKVATDYIRMLKMPFAEENMRFIERYTRTSHDTGFTIIFKNRTKVNDVLGKNKAENIIRNIVAKEEIEPFLNDSIHNAAWDKITHTAKAKFGELGEERVYGTRMMYYMNKEDWNNFGKYYALYYKTALARSEYHINNISWVVFERVSEPSVLKIAEEASKFNVEQFAKNDPIDIDTYANILYKLGKKQDAIKWEARAVQLSNNSTEFVETLNKMKNDIPTWK